ncbi:HAMP domain-containing sensor histidine kinase [Actibacterium sp. 188UL27-1]|uniref:sensor histidine kinase n=1 Tax=Actibacterium sp. 188UL27-1 TaxID=2786961 RepID=UPI00195ADBC9|nr:HAMP domain-containing sensor histidine kinase [Actibacterium sp. 188UL27-1]MBM7068764.1 HAMP domain-containing histidine kinase [Actibacterium sp. 188UL27-1]
MRITHLFRLYGAFYVAIILLLSTITLWNLERTRFWDARIDLAQTSYHAHLSLQSHTYQLLKQHADALLIGDRDRGKLEEELGRLIANDISVIRAAIGREIELVGEEEIEELAQLARIETEVTRLTSALSSLSSTKQPLGTEARTERLVDILDRQIDISLSSMINEALAEEREEVEETTAEAAAFRAASRQAVITSVILALAFLVISTMSFRWLIRQPLDRLVSVVRQFEAGQFSRDVRVGGGKEFQELGAVLNDMAAGLMVKEVSRKEHRDRLESMVSARTNELETLLRRIEQNEKNRRQLMADISHELRTPLTIIQGEAEVTLRHGDQPIAVYADALSRIKESARHTVRIVNDMLLVARQEADQLRLELQNINMRVILKEAIDIFPGKVDLIDELETEPRVRVDAVRMRQCLLAVFQNARRYGGPDIVARLNETSDHLHIIVEDNGPGMSDADRAQAFDRFFRGNNASRGDDEGTGLGLPIVRSIMEAHGGTVELQNGPESGLQVNLRLPKRKPVSLISTDTAQTPKINGVNQPYTGSLSP